MDLIDFFWPEEAQAAHLRRIAGSLEVAQRQAARARAASSHRAETTEQEVARLRDEVASLSLVTVALVRLLAQRGALTVDGLREAMRETDALDGAVDGRLSVEAMRSLVGMTPPVPPELRGAGAEGLCRRCHRRLSKAHARCLYCGGVSERP